MELALGNAEILRSPYLVKKLRDYETFRTPCYCMGKLIVQKWDYLQWLRIVRFKYDTPNYNLPTEKSMRESINEIVDCLERKPTNVHAKIFDVSPILSF